MTSQPPDLPERWTLDDGTITPVIPLVIGGIVGLLASRSVGVTPVAGGLAGMFVAMYIDEAVFRLRRFSEQTDSISGIDLGDHP